MVEYKDGGKNGWKLIYVGQKEGEMNDWKKVENDDDNDGDDEWRMTIE